MSKILFFVLLFRSLVSFGQDEMKLTSAFKNCSELPNMRDITISSDGKEGYVTLLSPIEGVAVITRIKKKKGNWKLDEIPTFSGTFQDLEPFLSPDNLRLYFASNRPLDPDSISPKDFDIWFVEREHLNAPWGDPFNLGAPVNTASNEFYPSVAINNNLYFTCDGITSKGKDDIFVSQFESNHYLAPISLSDSINSEGYEFNSYIDPMENYILFTAYGRKDGFGSGDLYISYKTEDGVWSNAKNLGSTVNSVSMDYCPFVDHSTKTLYFTSKRSSFEKTKPFKSLKELLSDLSKSENGMSRVYQIKLNKVTLLSENVLPNAN